MVDNRTPVGLALTGVALLIVGTALRELSRLIATGGLIVAIGWAFILVAVLWFVILLLLGKPRA